MYISVAILAQAAIFISQADSGYLVQVTWQYGYGAHGHGECRWHRSFLVCLALLCPSHIDVALIQMG
eukprot:4119171-Karenia_brevis.AAC.1